MAQEWSFNFDDLKKELEGEMEPDEELYEEDFEEIKNELPKKPSFPFGVLAVAIIKDLLDLLLDALFAVSITSIIGLIVWLIALIVISFINLLLYLLLSFWIRKKVGCVKRWIYRKFIFTFILEFVPGLNSIPQWTFFVVRAYLKECKQIDKILTAFEKIILRGTLEGWRLKMLEPFV